MNLTATEKANLEKVFGKEMVAEIEASKSLSQIYLFADGKRVGVNDINRFVNNVDNMGVENWLQTIRLERPVERPSEEIQIVSNSLGWQDLRWLNNAVNTYYASPDRLRAEISSYCASARLDSKTMLGIGEGMRQRIYDLKREEQREFDKNHYDKEAEQREEEDDGPTDDPFLNDAFSYGDRRLY